MLDLQAEHRQLVMKGPLKIKGTGSESSEMQLFLLDNYLLITKAKYENNIEKYKVHRKVLENYLQIIYSSQAAHAFGTVDSVTTGPNETLHTSLWT